MSEITILIPAYRPSPRLIEILNDLSKHHSGSIVVVNDGSGADFDDVFSGCRSIDNVVVLSNAINLGKGAALKYGINWILTNTLNVQGIVTADADGQHAVDDIARVARALAEHPTAFVLGYRQFSSDIPLRSRLGNNVSRVVYRGLLGLNLKDTQTGLRGLPVELARACLSIRSNRYEFETEQLTIASSMKVPVLEIGIKTIYEDHNASSHFNPLFDSARIYFVVLRYAFASIATTLVDIAAFLILLPFVPNVIAANLASRAVALGVQFLLLRGFVFQTSGGFGKFVLFVGYVALTGLVSGLLQREFAEFTGAGALASKLVVETLIFVFNFLFLRDILFRRK